MLTVTLRGMKNAQLQAQRIKEGLEQMRKVRVEIGTFLPWGYGIEYGRHRKSGKLARRAGGAMYLHRAAQTILADGKRDIAEGLRKVTRPGPWIPKRLGRWARRLARQLVPRSTAKRGSGKRHLYRSINVYFDRKRGR